MNRCNDDTSTMGQSEVGLSESGGSRVYLDFYNLRESPFSITPDPEFLFFSNTHKSVIDKILYGINNRMGFILLIGEVGTGKTTVCRSILDRLDGNAEMVYIINPSVSGKELISGILDDLEIKYPSDLSKKDLIDHLNHFLLSAEDKKPVVIIIDDAQTIPTDALEDLRLLSNLETDKEKLLQMVLVGQPEFLELIGRAEMRQLRQRVTINCRLGYLAREEIDGYIRRRLFVAGDNGHIRFSHKAIKQINKASKGIPRLINKVCDYALTAGYISDAFVIGPRHIKKALAELGDLDFKKGAARIVTPDRKNFRNRRWVLVSVFVLFIFLVFLFSAYQIDFNMLREKWGHKPFPNLNAEQTGVKKTNPVQEPNGSIPEQVFGKAMPSPTEMPVIPDSGPFPFMLLLGSYKTLANTIRAESLYRNKGIEVHWNYVSLDDEGSWYRMFTGRFKTIAEAKQYKKENELEESIIISAPWMVVVSPCSTGEELVEIQSTLSDNQYDYYSEKCGDGSARLLIGAFKTQAGAERLAHEVAKLNLTTQVVLR